MPDLEYDVGPLAAEALRANAALLKVLMEKLPDDTKVRVSALVAAGHQIAIETSTDRRGEIRVCLTVISTDARRGVLARLRTVSAPPASPNLEFTQ